MDRGQPGRGGVVVDADADQLEVHGERANLRPLDVEDGPDQAGGQKEQDEWGPGRREPGRDPTRGGGRHEPGRDPTRGQVAEGREYGHDQDRVMSYQER